MSGGSKPAPDRRFIIEAGAAGEAALNAWLKREKLSYVAVCQAKDTFSPLFSSEVKRPDFLLLLESVGLLAVDAKNYTRSGRFYTLKMESEVKRSVAFERLFRMPVWYAYYDVEEGSEKWYWISALKAVEVGEERTNGNTGEQFLAIELQHFEQISSREDLSKLYTHRLPSVKRIANLG
jgi:hypothetical protein